MRNKEKFLLELKRYGLQKCYLTDNYQTSHAKGVCFRAENFWEARDFAKKYNFSVSLCVQFWDWPDDVCCEVDICGGQPYFVEEVCRLFFPDTYVYYTPEKMFEKANELIEDAHRATNKSEKMKAIKMLIRFFENSPWHVITDGEDWHIFSSEYADESFWAQGWKYFYAVMIKDDAFAVLY